MQRLHHLALLAIALRYPAAGAVPALSLGELELRLLSPLSSVTSQKGTPVRAVVLSSFEVDGRTPIPAGAILHGVIRGRHSVGLGIIHERASLSLDFTDYEIPPGQHFPLTATLREIENSREYVTPNGQIKGILAADTPQNVLGGVWARPGLESFQRAFLGLSGVSGRIWKGYALGPYGGVALFALHCIMFRMPEPEIELPTGTELRLAITHLPADAPWFAVAQPVPIPADLASWIDSQPFSVAKINGRPVRDLINLAFIGTQSDLVTAFHAAGWSEAAPLTRHSASHLLGAFTTQTGYPEAPASRLTYNGIEPDFVFEKSFNNVLKRDHVRIWHGDFKGQEVWLAAATRDIGIGFDSHGFSFTHRIDSRIDSERRKIASDLAFAGCADSAAFVDRPGVVHLDSTSNFARTDGRLAVLQVHACSEQPGFGAVYTELPEASRFDLAAGLVKRTVRRMILEGRQYIVRENAVYWTYRAIKWSRAARRPAL